jgi:3-oxoacyl-(acyl-carrier-protein) synthase
MSVCIAGLGWVTPLGAELDFVWERLERGERAEVKPLENPETRRMHEYAPVPPKLVEQLGRNPRLRRSSSISYFAVAAGLAALENAGITMTPEVAEKTAVVFAITDGGVLYTRRFYEQIAKQGAQAASPLLFPETVYNAPASHLAALLGIDGASYTLVGDNSIGLAALSFAEQLLETSDLEQCVVVGSEEVDWVLCEAYRDWRLAGAGPQGALLAEGAGAVVLKRTGGAELHVHPGVSYFRRREAGAALEKAIAGLPSREAKLVVSAANGTFIDALEAAALARLGVDAPLFHPKRSLGEAPGASALWQIIAAVLALEKQGHSSALVPVLGYNQQASAALITRA